MTDSRSNFLTQTAHEYTECSNRVHYDRREGLCRCFKELGPRMPAGNMPQTLLRTWNMRDSQTNGGA